MPENTGLVPPTDIAILFDALSLELTGEEAAASTSVADVIARITGELRARGARVRAVGLRADLEAAIRSLAGSVVFNLAESFRAHTRLEPVVGWSLEAAGVAYTGAPPSALDRCLDKRVTRSLLLAEGIPVPRGAIVREGEPLDLVYPAIVKPSREDASHGIDAGSIVHDELSARARARLLEARYGAPALAEELIEGRELNVSVLEVEGALRVLPPGEIDFSAMPEGLPHILTFRAKWDEASDEYKGSPSRGAALEPALLARVENIARAAFRALGLRDYGRVDLRVCPRRGPFVIDVNPNPDLSPEAGFALAAGRAGLSYGELIVTIAAAAAARSDLPLPLAGGGRGEGAHATSPPPTPPASGRGAGLAVDLHLRGLLPEDREGLHRILVSTDAFREDELEVAMELIDAGLTLEDGDGYRFAVAERDGALVGYACWGKTPLTLSTFDLYWIAVDPSVQKGGVGRALLRRAEVEAAREGGSLLLIETSGQASYAATRQFYERCACAEIARFPDYYRDGDDKLVYARRLSSPDDRSSG